MKVNDCKYYRRKNYGLKIEKYPLKSWLFNWGSHLLMKVKKEKLSHPLWDNWAFLVAEMGFEPHDLRVMSPASYQTAPLRDIMVPEAGVEPVREKISRDFKSRASANSAIPAVNRASFTLA